MESVSTKTTDALGRLQPDRVGFGRGWRNEEIALLYYCYNNSYEKRRRSIARMFAIEAAERGFLPRTEIAIVVRLQRHFPDEVSMKWSKDEDNFLAEVFQEYPFERAYDRYSDWALAHRFASRSKTAIYARLSKHEISIKETFVEAGVSSLARGLGLSVQVVSKYLKISKLPTIKTGDKLICDTEKFYKWFGKEQWKKSIRGCIKVGSMPDLDSWSLLLNIPLDRIKAEWKTAEGERIQLRERMSFDPPMPVAQFARKYRVSQSGLRSAIRSGYTNFNGIEFEIA